MQGATWSTYLSSHHVITFIKDSMLKNLLISSSHSFHETKWQSSFYYKVGCFYHSAYKNVLRIHRISVKYHHHILSTKRNGSLAFIIKLVVSIIRLIKTCFAFTEFRWNIIITFHILSTKRNGSLAFIFYYKVGCFYHSAYTCFAFTEFRWIEPSVIWKSRW